MPRAPLVPLVLVAAYAAACAASVRSPAWASVMKDVGAHYKVVHKAIDPEQQGDLAKAAHAAREAARLVRTGYGAHEDLSIPRFGQYARECEQWLLAIAHEAQQGAGARARELLRGQDPCTKCHESAEKREW
jgi:hypothetical protein